MSYGIIVYDSFGSPILDTGDIMTIDSPAVLNTNQTVSANISKESGQYIFRTFNTTSTYGLWEEEITVNGNTLIVKSLVNNGKYWLGRF